MNRSDHNPEVAIVGAGPAGCAAAIQLARAGVRTIIFERKTFPREKVCGGCLSGLAMKRLTELAGGKAELPGVPLKQILFTIGSYRISCAMRGINRMCSRSVLDAWMARLAADAGAECRFGQAAQPVLGVDKWELVVGTERIRPAIVLLATGMSALPKQLGFDQHFCRRNLIGQMWFEPAESSLCVPGEVQMHWLRGGYVGIANPGEKSVVAIAAEIPQDRGTNVFENLRRRNANAAVWALLDGNTKRRSGTKGIAGFPWQPKRLSNGNLLLIGDAAGFEEPFSGEGIGQAIRSADCAVEAILSGHQLQHYANLMQGKHCRTMRRIRIIRDLIDNPVLQKLAECQPILPSRWFVPVVKYVHPEKAR